MSNGAGPEGRGAVPVSAVLIVYNEAGRIRRCLDSVSWADEIVVVDQSSTDATVAICREYTDKIHIVPNKGMSDPDRSFAVSKASNDWTFFIDADEVVSPALREEIASLMKSGPAFDSYYILRKNYLLGRWIRGSGWDPNRIIRLFRKGAVRFTDRIHVDIEPVGRSGYLAGAIDHYSYETIEDYIEKTNRYTTILAREAYESGRRVRPATFCRDLFILPAAYFIYKLVIKKGFRDGFRGFLIACFTFLAVFFSNVKLRARQEGQGR